MCVHFLNTMENFLNFMYEIISTILDRKKTENHCTCIWMAFQACVSSYVLLNSHWNIEHGNMLEYFDLCNNKSSLLTRNSHLWLKNLWQMVHFTAFSPEWILLCTIRLPECRNSLSHTLSKWFSNILVHLVFEISRSNYVKC